jgi:hypothetical protein
MYTVCKVYQKNQAFSVKLAQEQSVETCYPPHRDTVESHVYIAPPFYTRGKCYLYLSLGHRAELAFQLHSTFPTLRSTSQIRTLYA